jgi:hypothetical protein
MINQSKIIKLPENALSEKKIIYFSEKAIKIKKNRIIKCEIINKKSINFILIFNLT